MSDQQQQCPELVAQVLARLTWFSPARPTADLLRVAEEIVTAFDAHQASPPRWCTCLSPVPAAGIYPRIVRHASAPAGVLLVVPGAGQPDRAYAAPAEVVRGWLEALTELQRADG